MKDKKYVIEADSFEELAAKLVYVMKLNNEEMEREAKAKRQEVAPRIDVMRLVMEEGSKVNVTLSKKPADAKCRRGIRIDGYTLG